jgi:NADH dehydrogenase (ubiquinone) 1 beta subcomplex subunit 7
MHATQEQLRAAKVDLAYRDFCAHLLIPLNDCRKANYFLPWRCGHERHVYEKCQYKECVERVAHEPGGRTCPSRPPRPRSNGTRASNGRAPLRSNPKTHEDDRQTRPRVKGTTRRIRSEHTPKAGVDFFFH